MIRSLLLCFLWLASAGSSALRPQSSIDLSGPWKFQCDPHDEGTGESWFTRTLSGVIRLPGSMAEAGKGDDVAVDTKWIGSIVDSSYFTAKEYEPYRRPGNIKVPFWLNPVKHYTGAAWYQREVMIPASWEGCRITLFLERCHWETRFWIDSTDSGMRNSLASPHEYELPKDLRAGKHTLTLRVDNTIKDIDVGENAHSVSDHTQSAWNGIVGRIELRRRPLIRIADVRIFPDIRRRTARVSLLVRNETGRMARARVALSARTLTGRPADHPKAAVHDLTVGGDSLSVEYTYEIGGGMLLWDEFRPNLYAMKLRLETPGGIVTDERNVQFGMREFTVEGTRFAVNGRPVFLRGTLECAIFPATGYPPTDVKEWRRIFRVARAHGLNHMRFHSWCPPEAAFDAADREGFYCYVECCAWSTVGNGSPFDDWLYQESERIVRTYGNHPSFCMMSYGNEPAGDAQAKFLGSFVRYWKEKDARRVYTAAAGWPQIPENDFHVSYEPRIQLWGAGLKSIINSEPPQTAFDFRDIIAKSDRPVVSHEVGQWCVYPNFDEIKKYTGVLVAKNFEIFRASLRAHGMEGLAHDFLLASGHLQVLCYKADIEAALRTPGMAGFELLDLHDFPGQGTALVGVLDAFWQEKGYISPARYSRFCNQTVPLARLKKRIFLAGERFSAGIEIAHFGPEVLRNATARWRIADRRGRTFRSGTFTRRDIPWGNTIPLGEVDVGLTGVDQPEKLNLEVSVRGFSNDWDFWVYPAEGDEGIDPALIVTRDLSDSVTLALRGGARVLLVVPGGAVRDEKGGKVAVGFSSIFWNTAWTKGQPPHTLGILCDPKDPSLERFPTENHTNYQWWDALTHAQVIDLTGFPAGFKPIVRMIDDWFTNRPLGLIFEAKVGKGKLLVSGIDLLRDRDQRVEARQLLSSLERYASGASFDPRQEVDISVIKNIFKEQ